MNICQQTLSAAISAGISIDGIYRNPPFYRASQEEMERFCAMCIEAGRVAEREECAKEVEQGTLDGKWCGEIIRSRTTK